jgi:hypothetical protein
MEHPFSAYRTLQQPLKRRVSVLTQLTNLTLGLGLNLGLSLGLGLGLGTIGVAILETVNPSVAQAYVSRLAVSLNHSSGETYETLVRRAETVARAAAQRSFDNDILVNQVSVMISGTNKGIEVPILTLDVSRFQWRSQPDTRSWAVYFPGSRSMLGLPRTDPNEGLPPRNIVKPAPAPVVAPTPPALGLPGAPPVLKVPPATPPLGSPGALPGGQVPVRSVPGRNSGSVPLTITPPGGSGSLQTVPGSVVLPQPPVK